MHTTPRARSGAAVVALDIGTSSCRARLYDRSGAPVAGLDAHVPHAASVTADGGAELDPDALFEEVCQVVDMVSGQAGSVEIVGVGMSTFWHSLMAVDAHHRPLTPLYLWLDARSREDADQLRHELDERAIHARTGSVLHWSYWPAKLRWLARTQPDVFARAARWISFGEYVALRLFGKSVASLCMVSATGLLDQHTCDWDEEVLAAAGVRRAQMSPVVPLSQPLSGLRAEFAVRWPSLTHVPWVPAIGDGASSNLGADCTTRERFALMVGTSGAERVVWRASNISIPPGVWCYRVDHERLVLGGALNDGGSLFDWLRHTLQLPALDAEERAVAALLPDEHGLTVLPFWAGERSPGWAADARGAVLGLRLHTRPIEILRAALEAVALRFGELDNALRTAVPDGREVIATGRALLSSPAWMQIMADVLGRPVLASTEPEASSRGAALLALEALGLLEGTLDARTPATEAVFHPSAKNTALYKNAAERQRRFYELLIRDRPAQLTARAAASRRAGAQTRRRAAAGAQPATPTTPSRPGRTTPNR